MLQPITTSQIPTITARQFSEPLQPNATYQVAITPMVSGLPTTPFVYNFTTGTGPDTTPPTLVSVTPPSGTIGAPGGPITFRFSKPLAHQGSFGRQEWGWSYEALGGSVYDVTGQVSLSSDRGSITLKLAPDVRSGTVIMNPATLIDLAGNRVSASPAASRYLFYRVVDPSALPLQVAGHYPAAGQTSPGLAIDAPVQIVFNQPITSEVRVTATAVTSGASVALGVNSFANSRAVLVRPQGGWLPGTAYRITVPGRANIGATGIPATDDYSFEFTTALEPSAPATGPLVISSPLSPVYSSAPPTGSIPPAVQIVMRTVRPLPEAVLQYATELTLSGTTIVLVKPELSADRRTLTLTPLQPFAPGNYYPRPPEVYDIDGRQLSMEFQMQVVEPSPDAPEPSISRTTPLSGATNVPVKLVPLAGSEIALSAAQPQGALRLTSRGADVPGEAVLVAKGAVAFRPAKDLDPGTDYTLEAAGIVDVTGRTLTSRSISFRTAPAGYVPPNDTAVKITPAAGTETLEARHAVRMDFGRVAGSASVECSAVMNINQNRAGLFPIRTNWLSEREVEILPADRWPAGSFFRLSCIGSSLMGNQVYVTADYRTPASTSGDPAPSLVSVQPPSGSTVISADRVRLSFSQPMVEADGTLFGFSWIGDSVSYGAGVAQPQWSEDRKSVTITVGCQEGPCVLVPTGSLRSAAGVDVAPFYLSYDVTRAVSGTVRPLLRTDPPRGSLIRNLSTDIVLYLTGPVDLDTVRRSLRIFADLDVVAGEWAMLGPDTPTAVYFRPAAPLPYASTISLADLTGMLGYQGQATTFTTIPVPTATPVVSRVTANPPANGVIEVELTGEVPEGRFSAEVRRNNFIVPGTWRLVRKAVFRFLPATTPLLTGYYAIVMDGSWAPPSNYSIPGLTSPYTVTFDVGPEITDTRPNVTVVAPPDGMLNVALNTSISIVYEDLINPLTVNDEKVLVRFNGVPQKASATGDNRAISIRTETVLPPNTTVEVDIVGIEDRFGRPFPDQHWGFRTGRNIDTSILRLDAQPFNLGSAGFPLPALVPATQPIELRFNKPLDPRSYLPAPFQVQSYTVGFSSDLRSVILRPRTMWPPGQTVRPSLNGRDLYGNQCESYVCDIPEVRVMLDEDTTPPVLLTTSFADGETGVPLNSFFSFLFDSPVSPASYRGVRLQTGGRDIAIRSPGAGYSAPPEVLRVLPETPLQPNTAYTLTISGIYDSSGNTMAGSRTYTFTTGAVADFATGTPVLTTPVRPSDPVRFRFAEPMDFTADQANASQMVNVTESGTNGNYQRRLPGRFEVSGDRREIALYPEKPWTVGTTYTVGLGSTVDRAGNRPPDGYRSTSFTIPDAPLPEVPVKITVFPADGATNVPRNVIAFAGANRTGLTVRVAIYENGQPFTAWNYDFRSTIRFSTTLAANATYRIEATAADNADGRFGPFVSTFTTASAEPVRTSITLIGSTPENGASGVSPDMPLTMNFDRELFPFASDGGLMISRGTAGFLTVTTNTSGSAYRVIPFPYWPPAERVTVTLDRSRASSDPLMGPMDLAGNRLSAFYTTIAFNTGALADPEQPKLEQATPAAGSELPATDAARVTLRFNKPVLFAADSFRLFVNGQPASSYCQVSITDPRICVISFRPPAKANITIVGTAGIRDYSGNSAVPFTLDYTASEAILVGPVQVTLVEPRQYASAPATVIPAFQFDRPMDVATVLSGVRVTQDSQLVSGTVEDTGDGRNFRFRPSAPFRPGAQVSLIFPITIRDTDGRTFQDWQTPGFSITGTSTNIRTLELTSAGINADGTLPANAPIEVTFNAPLAPGTLGPDALWLSHRGGTSVAGRVTSLDANSVRFEPEEPLQPGVDYVLTVAASVEAAESGLRLTGGRRILFQAAADLAQPHVENVSQEGNDTIVYLSAPITAREASSLGRGGPSEDWLLAPDGRSIRIPNRSTLPASLAMGQRISLPLRTKAVAK